MTFDIFSVSVSHLSVIFGIMSIQKITHFSQVVFSMLTCVSSLYILNVNPSSGVSHKNIFFHSITGVFALLIVSSNVHKIFSLI